MLKNFIDGLMRRSVRKQIDKFSEFELTRFVDEIARHVAQEAQRRELSDSDRHQLLYNVQRQLLPEFVIADHGRTLLHDQKFRALFDHYAGENWTSFERKWNLKELLRLINDVPGDFAECGVFRGGSAHLMCEVAQKLDRHVHLFDSFEGLSAPRTTDGDHWHAGDLSVGEEVVHQNLTEFDCYTTYRGWIPQRFADVESLQFAFVHVDVDLLEPTRDAIEFFYPRLSPGGILLLDDHGFDQCPGARQTALEYFEITPVLDLATGQGLVIKPSPPEAG